MSANVKQTLIEVAEILKQAGWGEHRGGGDAEIDNSPVARNLINSQQMIDRHASGRRKALLEQLRTEVEELIARLPADKKDCAFGLAEDLEMLVKQAISDHPSRKWYAVAAAGLLDASHWANDIAGNIAKTISDLRETVWTDAGPRQAM